MDEKEICRLNDIALEMRRDALKMSLAAGSAGAHYGGGLSIVEIMCVLYMKIMHIDKTNTRNEQRDRFILSKGHGVLAYYAAMKQIGLISEETLSTFKQNHTVLYGHPSMNLDIGIEFSTGSLGQGLSLGVGSCLALRRNKNQDSRVYVLLGDGECDEGSIWEAAASAAHYKLNRLIAIVDKNKLQYDGETEVVLSMDDLQAKWKSFGWDTAIVDGHDVGALCEAFGKETDKPYVIIANTIKGKGISFMEGNPVWHHSTLTKKQYDQAALELEVKL